MTRSSVSGAAPALSLLACGPGTPPGTSPEPLPPDAGAVVRVDNPSFTDFNIADPIGSRVESMTHEIIVQPGNTVVLALRP